MSLRTTDRHRAKVSVTVSPEILRAVDAFVKSHPETDRSKVVEDALFLWYASQQKRAMEDQFAATPSPAEVEDRAAWRQIQQAAAARLSRHGSD